MRDDVQIVAPDREQQAEAVYDLIAKTFGFGGYYTSVPYMRRHYIAGGNYDWAASRIAVCGGEVAAHYGVWDYQMRIGRAAVRCGGIGCVATRGDMRKRGLMAKVAPAAVEAMRAAGYDFTVLFGIDDFYHRFGYTAGWGNTHYLVGRADLPKVRPPRLRKLPTPPPPEVEALYLRETEGLTGTAIRPTFPSLGFPGKQKGGYWTDAQGKLAGYVYYIQQGQKLSCVEAGGDPETVLAVLGRLARKWECPEVRFETLPHDGRLARHLRWTNCKVETSHRRCGGAMVRTLNLRSLLGKIAGELTRRVQNSGRKDWRGALTIADPREEVTLGLDCGQVTVLERPVRTAHSLRGGEEVARLLIGSAAPGEVLATGGIRASGLGAQLAEALFPEQHPQLCLWDRY